MHFWRIFCLYPDFGLHIFQGKVTPKSPNSSERNAISLADKAKPKAEIQVLKKRALYIPEQNHLGRKMFRRTSACQLKESLKGAFN